MHSPAHNRRRLWLAWGLLVVTLGTGCAHDPLVELRAQPRNPLAEQLSLYAKGGPRVSERTILVLRRYALNEGTDVDEVLSALAQFHEAAPTAESAYALAELAYVAAAKNELTHPAKAKDYYLSAVVFAYAYLFDSELDSARNPYDPQFRGASDLYNAALEKCLRIAQTQGGFIPGTSYTFESCGRSVDVSVVARGFTWKTDEFASFQFVSDFDLKGLTNQHQTHGLGVPLIAVRRGGVNPPEVEKYYARGFSFPVTAFLRLEPRSGPDGQTRINAVVELYDPLEVRETEVARRLVPLESDVSTPLAYFLDNPAMRQLDNYGLFRPDKVQKVAGLYMVQPYQPGKIPVLMVHGLWSSPMTWMEALNDLRSDPVLRENYQFWFYLYPTGEPFWQSAANLRDDLAEVHRVFGSRDGEHNLDQMVVVGHSMGGLISRMLTHDSGDRFWSAVSTAPLEQVSASDDVKRQLGRLYYFNPEQSVRRVVTIGTPHQGSEYANSFTRWLAQRLIALPKTAVDTTRQLLTLNPDVFRGGGPLGAGTSIDSLSPDSPILQVMHQTPKPEGVTYHNVVGVTKRDVPVPENTDGVVAFGSAHREDVASELVVWADHSTVHRHPRTIRELRRILGEHLAELRRSRQTIQLLGHEREVPLPPRFPTPAPSEPPPDENTFRVRSR